MYTVYKMIFWPTIIVKQAYHDYQGTICIEKCLQMCPNTTRLLPLTIIISG